MESDLIVSTVIWFSVQIWLQHVYSSSIFKATLLFIYALEIQDSVNNHRESNLSLLMNSFDWFLRLTVVLISVYSEKMVLIK